ncbi:hypothetical protein TKK_0013718 [Trichogramma kaykai]
MQTPRSFKNFKIKPMEYLSNSRKEIRFDTFCNLAARFLEDDADAEAVQAELREAFRLYDKEGNGYITTEVFRDILHELDDNLTPEELDMMIDEIDADGSGTLDFDGLYEYILNEWNIGYDFYTTITPLIA